MTEDAKELVDLERAPSPEEHGTEAEQYGAPAESFEDEGAGPDLGEDEGEASSSPEGGEASSSSEDEGA